MKKEIKMVFGIWIVCMFLTGTLIAQQGQRNRQQPKPPLLTALDTDGDRTISASELSDSTQSLKTLDKNNDGVLTRDELRPKRGKQNSGANNRESMEGKNIQRTDRSNRSRSTRNNNQNTQTKRNNRSRNKPPLFLALDSDGDNKISETEIDNAQNALRQLDTNGDGQLTRDEIRPKNRMQNKQKNRRK